MGAGGVSFERAGKGRQGSVRALLQPLQQLLVSIAATGVAVPPAQSRAVAFAVSHLQTVFAFVLSPASLNGSI